MQTVESILSFLAFSSILAAFSLQAGDQAPLDDSLYRLQLASDAWRVLYLRGALSGLGDVSRGTAESELVSMGRMTGLCFFLRGIDVTNCRGGGPRAITAAVRRTVIYDGKPETVSFSVGK